MGYLIKWEAEAERSQAHNASVRLLGWLAEHADNGSIVESQLGLTTSIEIADANGNLRNLEVSITGRADRIEFAANGVTVYDFKTAQKADKRSDVLAGIQLALYTLMIEQGTYEVGNERKKLESDEKVAGAALVYLRLDSPLGNGLPQEEFAEAGAHDRTNKKATVEQRIAHAARVIVNEEFATNPDTFKCGYCEVRFLCPAAPQGRQVLS
jgi:RecB family exonuclease